MALTLTQAQIDEIRRLRDAGPQNQTAANPLGKSKWGQTPFVLFIPYPQHLVMVLYMA